MEIFRPYKFDKIMFFTGMILIAGGFIMVFSTTGVLASEKHHQPFFYLVSQILGAFIGMTLIVAVLPRKKPFFKTPFFVYGLLSLSIFLLGLCLTMPPLANTRRWVQFLGIRFQPSELVKISLILFLAYYIDKKQERLNNLRVLIFPLAVIFTVVFLVILEPDYGTAILIMIICMFLLYLGGLQYRYFFILGGVSIIFFAFYLFDAPYRINRILAFLFPSRDPLGLGYHIIQSKRAVGAGGIIGVSMGESTQKLFYLPCAHTDFIYAIIGEEIGFIGAFLTLCLFLIIFWRGLVISGRLSSSFFRLTALGLTLYIFFQALLNITIVLGLGPPTGIPLPLISYGRSSLVCTLFGLGILLNISQRREGSRRKG
ncbi:MAG: cell division protein FtsW [Candidatus Aminicenantes bacterium]|nr:cell division protein FtsW [Candidatus Aminicenantes bacterium]